MKDVKIGARVGVRWIKSVCNSCDFCLAGVLATTSPPDESSLTIEGRMTTGVPHKLLLAVSWSLARTICWYGRSTFLTGFLEDVGGSFQQYVTAPGDYLVPIPDNVPDEAAAPLLCAGVTMYRALKVSLMPRRRPISPLMSVSGLQSQKGGLDRHQRRRRWAWSYAGSPVKDPRYTRLTSRGRGIKFAQVMGLRVIAVDIGLKADFCRRLGAEHFVDVLNTSDLVGTVKRLTSDKATAVIATASNAQAYQDAARMLGNGGTLVCVGLRTFF